MQPQQGIADREIKIDGDLLQSKVGRINARGGVITVTGVALDLGGAGLKAMTGILKLGFGGLQAEGARLKLLQAVTIQLKVQTGGFGRI